MALYFFFVEIISVQKLLLSGDEIDYRGGIKSYERIFFGEKPKIVLNSMVEHYLK